MEIKECIIIPQKSKHQHIYYRFVLAAARRPTATAIIANTITSPATPEATAAGETALKGNTIIQGYFFITYIIIIRAQ